MPTTPKKKRFAFYHQNEALLYQFMLHECLNMHRVLDQRPSNLLHFVMGMTGKGAEFWHHPSGHLPRLRYYGTLFITHFTTPVSPFGQDLIQTIGKAHEAALAALRAKDEQEQEEHYIPLKQAMSSCLTLLHGKLNDYQDDPSVLYFLLRHREQFDAAYSQPIIKKTFETFFPAGMQQAHAFLTECFSKKGFDHLIPFIGEQLKEMGMDDER